jgi:hypothetical protein
MQKYLLALSVLLLVVCSMSLAQSTNSDHHDVIININSIALLDLEGPNVTLDVTRPTNAGDEPVGDSDNGTYLNYTSTVASSASRSISAQITAGSVPAGVDLKLAAVPAARSNEGTSAGQVTLDDKAAHAVVTGIGSCATGAAASDGARCTYTLEVSSYSALEVQSNTTMTVTYTISAS